MHKMNTDHTNVHRILYMVTALSINFNLRYFYAYEIFLNEIF